MNALPPNVLSLVASYVRVYEVPNLTATCFFFVAPLSIVTCARKQPYIYIFGGGRYGPDMHYLSSVERFNAQLEQWDRQVDMDSSRMQVAAVVLGGRIILCGGMSEERILESVVRFDPEIVEWTGLRRLLEGRAAATTSVIDGKIYICGGFDQQRRILRSVERYNSVGDVWEPWPAMRTPRFEAIAATLCGQLYICGGSTSERGGSGECISSSVERFDPRTHTW